MPQIESELETATPPRAKTYRHRVADGLYLNVTPAGARSWVQRIMVEGKRRDIGLGRFPTTDVGKAHELAKANRVAIAEGRNPLAERRAAKAEAAIPTFREAAERTWQVNRPRWRSAKVADEWRRVMRKYAYPHLGDTRVDKITRRDVVAVLDKVWTAKPETAKKLRQHITATLGWAHGREYCRSNVATEIDRHTLPRQRVSREHHRALPYVGIMAALVEIDRMRFANTRLALRFLILTAARSGEVRGALWSEIDMDARVWTVPAERMKGGRPHRVPLSDATMAVLEEAKALRNRTGLVFPSRQAPHGELSDKTFMYALNATWLGKRTVVHGFRSSFRDWASERSGASWAAMEMSLAHSVGDSTVTAYARSDLLDQRRAVMEAWAAYLAA